MYEYVLARTKVMDAEFISALQADFDQIVLLGAGFDTRALRFTDLNRGTRIFELDIATTQQPKIEVLQRKKIKIPAELRFVPIDFEKENLSDVLSAAGYQEGRKSLFLWEGVSMYLNTQAVDETLGFIRACSASGSRIAFDYIFASVLGQERRLYGEREAYDMVSKVGEGWTFGIGAGEIVRFLAVRGFEIVVHYTPAELERIYLTAENGYRYGRVNGTHCIVIASVN
jgi:methyltransferase (TIGR00027 family)